ncbi:MAG: PKD domain-containing protein [Rhodonellum sp.]|nr:PKD domain-containing protein [Rhodonellum sp.]
MLFPRVKSRFFLLFTLLFSCFLSQTKAQIGFPYCESFQDNSAQSTTVFGGDASLTSGVLRLTNNQIDQNGFVYIDIPFSSVFGIKTSFEYFSYGGSGADGLTVFLFDANTPNFAPGGFGGSLGYAQRNQDAGLTRAYLGVGFDSFGNYGNSSENKNGGFPGGSGLLHPNSVVIRGPGSGSSGYAFINGKKTNSVGPFGFGAGELFELSSGGIGTTRVTDPNVPGYRKVIMSLDPNPNGPGFFLTVQMEVTTSPDTPRMMTIFENVPYLFDAPKDLKIGFSASTGGMTNFHEIRNIVVQVANDENLLNPIGENIADKASCEGQENTYEIKSSDVNLPNENSTIGCLQLFASLEDIISEEEDFCSQGKCKQENRELVLPQGTFRASDEGGKFTFFPNFGFRDEEVIVYYTITDSYGKTSAGNSIKLLIQESPEPVRIQVKGFPEGVSEVRFCESEVLELLAVGNEAYVKYEWFKDDELISGSDAALLAIDVAGNYQVIAYNSKGCPTDSGIMKLINPPLPPLSLMDPMVGCVPGIPLDIRSGIEGYNDELFDYELETQEGEKLINEEMGQILLSGTYSLRIKNKDLSCWSAPIDFEVILLKEKLVTTFDYEIEGLGIKDDAGGGIFMDDPIRFNSQSIGDPVQWLWDFGDGNASTEPSPVHVYGKKGVFQVSLTITNAFGCEDVFELDLPITKSYRIMFPTGFTPASMENQFFRPKTKGIVKMELLVFNLWGELIFKSEDLNSLGWDGRKNGELAPVGNYVYRVNLESIDGEKITESGKFTLIR